MNTFKRISALIMLILMLVSSLPISGIVAASPQKAGVTTQVTAADKQSGVVVRPDRDNDDGITVASSTSLIYGDAITRAQWLHNLAVVFDMTVESDDMPDNYYSDLSESHQYYSDIILNVEFGVIDIPAGGKLYPDKVIDRDFAVKTLNFCLGYRLDEGEKYTFSDSADCSDPVSAQIAVDRGWVALSGGKFLPALTVTSAEAKKMLDDAAAVLAESVVADNYTGRVSFAYQVKTVPMGTELSYDEEAKKLSIISCPVEISKGEKFTVFYDSIPKIYEAVSVTKSGNVTVVTVNDIDASDAVKDMDIQGIVGSEELDIIPADGVEVEIEDVEDESGLARASTKKKSVKSTKKLQIANGVTVTLTVKVTNARFEYEIKGGRVYLAWVADTEVKYSLGGNLTELLGGFKTVPIFTVKFMGVGSFDVNVTIDLSGSCSGTIKNHLVIGVEKVSGQSVRMVRTFKQTDYYFTMSATAGVALEVSLGADVEVASFKGYGKVGMQAVVESTYYSDGKYPQNCTHFGAYMFASVGVSCSITIIGWETEFEEELELYNADNSPVRFVTHYENGNPVASCQRGNTYYNFFTKWNSRWNGCGWRGGNGRYGLDGNGNPIPLYYYSLADGKATITSYNGNSSYVAIPTELDGYPVVAIGASAFAGKRVCSVTIPEGVTSVGIRAFENCGYLSEVSLPSTLMSLGGMAFANTALESVHIPKSLESCGYELYRGVYAYDYVFRGKTYGLQGGPFYGCERLRTATFEDGITFISDNLFNGCTGLTTVTIPDTVTKIEASAFKGALRLSQLKLSNKLTLIENEAFRLCVSLTGVTITDSVTEIYGYAFDSCENLSEVKLSKNLASVGGRAFAHTALSSVNIPKSLNTCGNELDRGIYEWSYNFNGVAYSLRGGPFYCCEDLKTVTFEDGATKIPGGLFSGCTGLEEIVIPDTVSEIGGAAFRSAVRLKKVTFGKALTVIGDDAFAICVSLPEAIISDSVTSIGGFAFADCPNLKKVTLSKKLKTLGGKAFAESGIESVFIPKSLNGCGVAKRNGVWDWDLNYNGNTLKGVRGAPFYNCQKLKKVEFEEGIEVIDENLFATCIGLEEIVIPDTVVHIESYAFRNCFNLKKVTMSDSVKRFGDEVFLGCASLTDVKLSQNVEYIWARVFSGCTSLETVDLPDNLTTVSNGMFNGCTALKSIEIPASVTKIDENGFKGCTALENLTVSEGGKVDTINKYAFENCYLLKDSNIFDSAVTIADCAFKNCDKLTKAELPATLKTLGKEVFYGCDSLKTVSFTDYSITTLNNNAFMECPELTEVTLPKGLTAINSQAFKNSPKLTKATIPQSVTKIEASAFSYPTVTVIYGVKESTAETYANDGGYKFVDIGVSCEGFMLLDGVDKITLDVGESYRAEFEYFPENTTDIVTVTQDSNKLSISGLDLKGERTGDTMVIATTTSGITYEFSVHVRDVSKLEIVTMPQKTSYNIGAELDLTGLELRAVYNDGSVKDITDYTVSGYDKEKEGTQTLTLTYTKPNGRTVTCTFKVDVIDNRPKVNAIRITKLPDKLQYLRKESLDVTGMVVEAVYTDGSTKVISDYTTSGYNALMYGEHTVTVRYGDFTATFTVEVVEEIHVHTWGDWYVETEPTYDTVGTERRDCTSCDGYETKDIPVLPRVPVLTLDGYDIRITLAEDMTYIRYAPGTYTTSSDIKNAPGCVTLDAKTIGENTVDGDFVKNFPEGGVYSFWVKFENGNTYIFNCDMADMEQYVTSDNLDITVHNLYGVRDFFIVKGDYNSYTELKNNYIVRVTSTKIAGAHSYTYRLAEEALYTVLVRYDNSSRADSIFKQNVSLHTHSYESAVTVIPTCMGEGVMTYTCVCGDNYTEVIPATGEHQWRAWSVHTESTYTEEGKEMRGCETCDSVEYRPIPVKEYVNPFGDVKDSHWFASAVTYVVKKGYMNGMSPTNFSPNGNIKREQFVLILANIAGVDTNDYKNTSSGMTDVPTGQWYSGAVAWAVKEEYVSGMTPTTFGRGKDITRAQLARMFYTFAGKNGFDVSGRAELSGFADATKVQDWMRDGLEWAVDAGIISGMNIQGKLSLNPNGTATRAQAAVMLTAFDKIK